MIEKRHRRANIPNELAGRVHLFHTKKFLNAFLWCITPTHCLHHYVSNSWVREVLSTHLFWRDIDAASPICTSPQFEKMVVMHMIGILAMLVAPYEIEGFAPIRRVHTIQPIQHNYFVVPMAEITSTMSLKSTNMIEIPIQQQSLNKVQSKIVKSLMITYILSMCVALPTTLFPVYLLHKVKVIDRVRKEKWSLKVAQLCSRSLMRVFPFASKQVLVNDDDDQVKNPQPSIWVCNHVSMLDLFFVLALDKKMRGKKRRPIKILYWKQLESNPITGLMCKMCGFIPVEMADNGSGNDNEYDPKSFKKMLKSTKTAIEEGFDIGILPEGQLNPTPEKGLRPIFTGAFTLAKMSRRPIKIMAMHGLHRMWHPDDNIGMTCTARNMTARVFPNGRMFSDAEEFKSTFEAVAGYFGAHGKDMPKEDLQMWLDGTMWQKELAKRAGDKKEIEVTRAEPMKS